MAANGRSDCMTLSCLKSILVLIALCASGGAQAETGFNLAQSELEAAYASANDKFVHVDGVNFRVRIQGSEDAQTIVLIHGYTSSLETWDAAAAELSEKYNVIRYDLSGHGLTGPDQKKRYTAGERAHLLSGLLQELNVSQPIIVGNSLGGMVAWKYAARYPDDLKKLILISPSAFPFAGLTETPQPIAPAMEAYLRFGQAEDVNSVYSLQFFDKSKVSTDRIEQYHKLMRRDGNAQAFVEHMEAFALPDPREELEKIQAQTLVLWGREDRLISVDQAEQIAKHIPNSQVQLLDSLGHIPQEEAPRKIIAAMMKFLNPDNIK